MIGTGKTGTECPLCDRSEAASIMIELIITAPATVEAGPIDCSTVSSRSMHRPRDTGVDCKIDDFKKTQPRTMTRRGRPRLPQIGDGYGADAALFHLESHLDGRRVTAGI